MSHKYISFFILVFFAGKASGQWAGSTSMTMDGLSSEACYVTNSNYNICWDATYLYLCKKGGTSSEPVIVYFDIDPVSPVTWGTNSSGNVTGKTDLGITPNNPFRADLRIYWTAGSAPEYETRDGSGGWSSSATMLASGNYGNNGSDRELRIAWNLFPGLSGLPSKFNFFGFASSLASPTGYTYDASPADNPSAGTYTTPNCEYYWRCNNTSSTGTHNPFNFKCYTYLGSGGNLGYIADIYDLNINKSSTTIHKTDKWIALGTMTLSDGTIEFDSNTDSLRVEDSLVIMGTGNFNMETSKSVVWVKKTFAQKSSVDVTFSSDKDSKFIVSGNFRNESNLSSQKTHLTFHDFKATPVLQTISGNLSNDNSIYVMEVDNTAGLSIQVSDSLTVRDSFIFTSGKITVAANRFLKFRGNIVIINNGGPTDGKFIEGKLARQLDYTNDSIFHVGKGNIMARCAIQPNATSSGRIYIVEYHNSPHQYSGSSSGNLTGSSGLDHTSFVENWEISCNQSGSNDDAIVTLYWTSNSYTSSSGTDRANLRVARWVGGSTNSWDREGDSPTIIDNGQNDGSIKANQVSADFSDLYFTIGSNTSPNPLPVSLLNLRAQRIETNLAKISWQTAHEVNNKGFEIWRSEDGENYENISFVSSANSNSNSTLSYEFLDHETGIGTVYYKLKQVDFNNHFEWFGPVYIEDASKTGYNLYPNPSRGLVHFNANKPIVANTYISVFDLTGKLVLSKELVHEMKFDLSPGSYIVQFSNNQGPINKHKLVIIP